jgi:hypothetical protein
MRSNPVPAPAACPKCGKKFPVEEAFRNERTGEVTAATYQCPQHGVFQFLGRSGMIVMGSPSRKTLQAPRRKAASKIFP